LCSLVTTRTLAPFWSSISADCETTSLRSGFLATTVTPTICWSTSSRSGLGTCARMVTVSVPGLPTTSANRIVPSWAYVLPSGSRRRTSTLSALRPSRRTRSRSRCGIGNATYIGSWRTSVTSGLLAGLTYSPSA
jgi:hypothetical protein